MRTQLNFQHTHKQQYGVTLIELIISMVVISIAITGVFAVMDVSVRRSADPVIQQQAITVAEAYLEEILLQAYNDPDGDNTGETRATYDNVADYAGLSDSGAHDRQGALISNLTEYQVSVAVALVTVTGIANVQQVTVAVTAPGISALSLVGYKYDY
ncbi:MAG: prepilin-type N-terminal cleavage/methylation domain-containing protein [Methylococcales bacterium]